MEQFHKASVSVNGILDTNKSKINGIVTNFNKVSGDFSKISDSLQKADLGKTVKELNCLIDLQKKRIERTEKEILRIRKDRETIRKDTELCLNLLTRSNQGLSGLKKFSGLDQESTMASSVISLMSTSGIGTTNHTLGLNMNPNLVTLEKTPHLVLDNQVSMERTDNLESTHLEKLEDSQVHLDLVEKSTFLDTTPSLSYQPINESLTK